MQIGNTKIGKRGNSPACVFFQAFAENITCLSQKLANPLFYLSLYFLFGIPFIICTVVPEPGGPGGATGPPPIFCRSVNPTETGEGRFSPPITTGPPNVFHLPASL